MGITKFISSKIKFSGPVAVISVAVSFIVMIVAASIASGFRHEIRKGISEVAGDIQLFPIVGSFLSDDMPIPVRPSYYEEIVSMPEVKEVVPAVYRAGIIRENDIYGAIFKGVQSFKGDSLASGEIIIPSSLSKKTMLNIGDKMTIYFAGKRVKIRSFKITGVYNEVGDAEDKHVVFAPMHEMRRLNGWNDEQASVLEVNLHSGCEDAAILSESTEKIGFIACEKATDDEPVLIAKSITQRFPRIFDWLGLIDFNVLFVLILMIVVAGFNMISGALIMLFRHISSIGVLKSMGMTDSGISRIFLRSASSLVLKGMLIGNLFAVTFCWIQKITHIIKLDPANYFISFVPIHLNLGVILAIDVVAYLLIMLLLFLPTLFIAGIDPADTARAR